MRVATSAQIAELDRRATKDHGISVAQLMDAAGRRVAQAAEIMLREHGGRRVVVMAGRGSNGGDGLVAARRLAAGAEVAALLVAPKEEVAGGAGQALAAAAEAGGSLMAAPSIATWLVTAAKVRELLPRRRPDTHKGTYGHVLILAGSVGYTGAAVLSTFGALRSGAGLVTVAVPQSVYPIVASKVTEGIAMPLADDGSALSPSAMARVDGLLASCDVVAAGPGLSPAHGVARVVEELLGRDKPLVLDADGLNVLAGRADRLAKARPPVVITPHPGELGRLLKQPTPKIVEDRLGAARAAAARFRCVVVLKSAHTVVAKPDGEAAIIRTGNPGMASGGMGDVLTAAVAPSIRQGLAPLEAPVAAPYRHGLARDLGAQERGQVGLLASDVADGLPHAIQRVQAGLQVDPIRQLRD